MSRYGRARIAEGVFFFTVALADRSSDLLVREIGRLRQICMSVQRRRPFETVAICVLPDHIHAIWSLPARDWQSVRWTGASAGGLGRRCP
jgi:putative transposase